MVQFLSKGRMALEVHVTALSNVAKRAEYTIGIITPPCRCSFLDIFLLMTLFRQLILCTTTYIMYQVIDPANRILTQPPRGCVAARCGSSQYPQFDPCSPQSLQ